MSLTEDGHVERRLRDVVRQHEQEDGEGEEHRDPGRDLLPVRRRNPEHGERQQGEQHARHHDVYLKRQCACDTAGHVTAQVAVWGPDRETPDFVCIGANEPTPWTQGPHAWREQFRLPCVGRTRKLPLPDAAIFEKSIGLGRVSGGRSVRPCSLGSTKA